jgi:hypothetical protein
MDHDGPESCDLRRHNGLARVERVARVRCDAFNRPGAPAHAAPATDDTGRDVEANNRRQAPASGAHIGAAEPTALTSVARRRIDHDDVEVDDVDTDRDTDAANVLPLSRRKARAQRRQA